MDVLLDNTSFAGVMRCYKPALPTHADFWRRYPEHKDVDRASLAQFLTTVCLFDQIHLDSSSLPSGYGWEQDGRALTKAQEMEIEGYNTELVGLDFNGNADEAPIPWVYEMAQHLPPSIRSILSTTSLGLPEQDTLTHSESCEIAYDIFCSGIGCKLLLLGNWKIPNVYTDSSYVLRGTFEAINAKNRNLLDERYLAHAMFLHRGLFLLSRARKEGHTYLPYFYRGNMLSTLSPLLAATRPSDGVRRPRMPFVKDMRPDEDEFARLLNEAYYQLLEKTTWHTYDLRIPFVGAAILAKAKGDTEEAFQIALNLRREGSLRREWDKLRKFVQESDRGRFESQLSKLTGQIEEAATAAGAHIKNRHLQVPFRLAVSWMPGSIAKVVEAALDALPDHNRYWVNKFTSLLVSKSVLQMLFLDHVGAIRSGSTI